MNNALCFLIGFLLSFSASAEVTKVRGVATGYEGKLVAIVGVQDEFSGKRFVLGQSEIDESGHFEVEFHVTCTQRVYIHIQRLEAPIFVQPGKSYSVVFPKMEKVDYKRFDNTEVSLELIGLPEDDVNLVIRKFNSDYATFLRDHFYDFALDEYRGAPEYIQYKQNQKENVDLYQRRSVVDTLNNSLEKGFSRWVMSFEDSVNSSANHSSDTLFTQAYKKYACAELHLLSGLKRAELYRRYFYSDSILEHNPAFCNCFRLFTQNCLIGQSAATQAAIKRAIDLDRDLLTLSEAINPEMGLSSGKMKCLAALVAIKDVSNKGVFDRTSIELLLEKVATGDSVLDSLASASLFQMRRCHKGWKIQDFIFSDENQDRWKLSDASGLPIYMLFFATWSPASMKEIQVLSRWQEKYKGRVQMIAVCMDDDYKNYRRYLEGNLKIPLTVLFGNAEPFIHEKLNIKAIPHFILLDEKGVVQLDHCPSPTDYTFEAAINRVVESGKNSHQGPRTWKGH
jgi:thiol-disulfide isomerase/thioredoxin